MERIKIPKGASIKYYPEDSVIEIIPAEIEEKKNTFEIGKWYNTEGKDCYFLYEKDQDGKRIGKGFVDGEYYPCIKAAESDTFELSDIKEVSKLLIEEAENEYKKGLKIDCLYCKSIKKINFDNISCIIKNNEFRVYFGSRTIYTDSKGWAEIIKPDYINSLKEVFYYGYEVYCVDKKSYQLFTFSLNHISHKCETCDITEIMTKASAEKWIEDNKPERISGIYKIKKSSIDDYELARWSIDHWSLFGDDRAYIDDNFYDINEDSTN